MPTIRIRRYPFPVQREYAEGHQLTAGEAQAMTQLLCENVRNNVDGWVQRVLAPDGTLSAEEHVALQLRIAEYAREYQFQLRAVQVASPTLVEQHARAIALQLAQRDAGLGPDEQPDERLVLLHEATVAVQAEARRRAEADQQAARAALAELAQ